jgi:hypothetical protein
LRFVLVSRDGVVELAMPPADQQAVIAAVDHFGAELRRSDQVATDVARLIPDLLDAVGPALKSIVEAATKDLTDGRLVWVPQGPLAAIPFSALRCGDGVLVDRVSVLYAESLQAVPMNPPSTPPSSVAVAIRGIYGPGQAATEGCAAVVGAETERVPETLGDLNQAVKDASPGPPVLPRALRLVGAAVVGLAARLRLAGRRSVRPGRAAARVAGAARHVRLGDRSPDGPQ